MSQWQEFGYPDLAGVSFQTALHGLIGALKERLLAETVSNLAGDEVLDICEKANAYPIYLAVRRIEQLFGRMTNFLLPDGTRFSPENAAAFLQEELVQVTANAGLSVWTCPYSGMMYEWLSQRYRFLNLAYKISPSGYLSTDSIWERWRGQGESFNEAVSNLELYSHDISNYISFNSAVISSRHNDSWDVEKLICVPARIRNPFAFPCLLCCEIKAQMSRMYCGNFSWQADAAEFTGYPGTDQCWKWLRDDFDLGITFNTPQIFFSRQIDDDSEFCTTIELPEFSDRVLTLLHETSFSAPPSGYKSSRLIKGFEAQFNWFGDFRNTFKFYDPL